MRRFVKLVILNHSVITEGKIGGALQVEGRSTEGCWF